MIIAAQISRRMNEKESTQRRAPLFDLIEEMKNAWMCL